MQMSLRHFVGLHDPPRKTPTGTSDSLSLASESLEKEGGGCSLLERVFDRFDCKFGKELRRSSADMFLIRFPFAYKLYRLRNYSQKLLGDSSLPHEDSVNQR